MPNFIIINLHGTSWGNKVYAHVHVVDIKKPANVDWYKFFKKSKCGERYE